MARYFSHTVILPDESRLDDFIVEVAGGRVSYYPFVGEVHSTVYIEGGILLSHRDDLQAKTVSLDQLAWAMGGVDSTLYAYSLSPCSSCMGNRFVLSKLE